MIIFISKMLMVITLVAFCFSDTWTWLFSLWVLIFFFCEHLKLQKLQDLEFFWFFEESEFKLITLHFVFLTLDTWKWLFSLWILIFLSANTWKYNNLRIKIFFLILQSVWFDLDDDQTWTWLFSLWVSIFFSPKTWNYKNRRI